MLLKLASAGNRTRAARVAGEHSTTEPPMHAQPARTALEFAGYLSPLSKQVSHI